MESKQLSKKESLTLLKQKEIFEKLANERMGQIQNLNKQIDFNNLIYLFKRNRNSKKIISSKDPLDFYRNIKDVYRTLEKAEESQKENLNQIEMKQ